MMANGLILGADGFNKFALGYPVNVNDDDRRTCTIAQTETDGVLPGALLAVTEIPGVYKNFGATSDIIAGIALATNVKLDQWFPQSDTEVKFQKGNQCGVVVRGEVAVKFYGTAPTEGAKVYYDFTHKAFTATETGNVPFPGARFMGKVEGDLTSIFVQYI